MSSIRLSPKHGVNPSMSRCYMCGGPKNELILAGRLRGPNDKEAPRSAVWNMEPCDQCAHYMKIGVILISIRDGEPQTRDPYRTGKFAVVTEDFCKRVFTEPSQTDVLTKRMAFIEDGVWSMLGLPEEKGAVQ